MANKTTLKHLKGDANTWSKIENIAHRERQSDLKLIKKLR